MYLFINLLINKYIIIDDYAILEKRINIKIIWKYRQYILVTWELGNISKLWSEVSHERGNVLVNAHNDAAGISASWPSIQANSIAYAMGVYSLIFREENDATVSIVSGRDGSVFRSGRRRIPAAYLKSSSRFWSRSAFKCG